MIQQKPDMDDVEEWRKVSKSNLEFSFRKLCTEKPQQLAWPNARVALEEEGHGVVVQDTLFFQHHACI
jgi:hypothetical protein